MRSYIDVSYISLASIFGGRRRKKRRRCCSNFCSVSIRNWIHKAEKRAVLRCSLSLRFLILSSLLSLFPISFSCVRPWKFHATIAVPTSTPPRRPIGLHLLFDGPTLMCEALEKKPRAALPLVWCRSICIAEKLSSRQFCSYLCRGNIIQSTDFSF